MDDALRYPIGRFTPPAVIAAEQIAQWTSDLEQAPAAMRAAVAGLAEGQLDTPYRPGGWTVRQVVHHLADSNLILFSRFKFALTADEPLIQPFDEEKWAELAEARTGAVEPSLLLLEGLHARWTALLRALSADDLARAFRHPVSGAWTLARATGQYAWHCRHHTAQITALRRKMGW